MPKLQSALKDPDWKFPTLTALLGAFLLLAPGLIAAQTPLTTAWSILQAGAVDKNREKRVATMRVLHLIPDDAKAIGMAELGLKDDDPKVRGAAATSLGSMKSKSSIPQLTATAKSDKEGAVVMAAARSLIQLGDEKGYEVYYAVLTGQRKSGDSLIGGEERELKELLKNPEQMEEMAFEQGIGFVPYGGIGLQVFKTIHESEMKEPIIKSNIDQDPGERSGSPNWEGTGCRNRGQELAGEGGRVRCPGSAQRSCAVTGLNLWSAG